MCKNFIYFQIKIILFFFLHRKQLQSTCPAGASIIQMTTDLQNLILGEHNNYRNAIASGSVSPFKTAARMATTVCYVINIDFC